jgi:S-adenosylmethionine:tRNA ribosyltransferase-isomerase
VLVLNDSRVIQARLHGKDLQTGRTFEILLLEENGVNDWWTMVRPGKNARLGTQIKLCDREGKPAEVIATVLERNAEGHRRLWFTETPNVLATLERLGEVPLPPYITRSQNESNQDRERYQTIFATAEGSVAAPTAGLHFTEAMLNEIRARGINVCFVTLHVGFATFAPVRSETITDHRMHQERFELGEETVRVINDAKRKGKRVVAVGTTTVRVLETLASSRRKDELSPLAYSSQPHFLPVARTGKTRIFIYPPYKFKIVDALLTNFHLPRSTLLMLVSAFAAPNHTKGRELILKTYAEAVRERYRFFSYGDAMLVL